MLAVSSNDRASRRLWAQYQKNSSVITDNIHSKTTELIQRQTKHSDRKHTTCSVSITLYKARMVNGYGDYDDGHRTLWHHIASDLFTFRFFCHFINVLLIYLTTVSTFCTII